MNRKIKSRALQLFSMAMQEDLGLRVATNDASRLQQELAQVRVHLRKEGIDEYDGLSFRVLKEKGEDQEFVFITKRLSPEQIAELISGSPATQEEPDDGPEETER